MLERKLNAEASFPWLGLVCMTHAYMKEVSQDMSAEKSILVSDLLGSDIVDRLRNCNAKQTTLQTYFGKLKDMPLACCYGGIAGTDETDPSYMYLNGQEDINANTLSAIQESFSGQLLCSRQGS